MQVMIKERFIELIDKYLSGTATDSERQLVEEYLIRLEANDGIVSDSKQEQMLKEAMWRQIQQQTNRGSAQVVQISWYKRKGFRLIAVAASFILLIGLGVFLITRPDKQSIVVKNNKLTKGTLFIVHREVNTTGKEKRVQLPDGSLIVLADKSAVTYRDPFIGSRDINLTGKAFFKVAKDKTKPFTVVSGDISTTALGTEFSVTVFKNTNHIVVRLYKGKVVVKPVSNGNKRMKSDVYLLPGQELIYGGITAKVRTFGSYRKVTPGKTMDEDLADDNPSIPQNTKASYYMFNNQSLTQVLDNLAALYEVKIVYNKKDLQNIYFTGKYNRSDSLEPILKRIGILNNLTITKKDNAFIISR